MSSVIEDAVVIPSSPIVDKKKNVDQAIKVSCRQGTLIFLGLATALGVLMGSVIYVGYYANLHDEGSYHKVLTVLLIK